MYRISFNPRIGAWRIQILMYGFLWVSVADSYNLKKKPFEFETYDKAMDQVKAFGLDKAYRMQLNKVEWLFGGQTT